MALDPGIFAQFGVKPKSSFEYLQEMDAADAAKQAKESNRLALLIQQGQYQDQTAARERANALRTDLQSLGADAGPEQQIGVYQRHGEVTQANALRKSLGDQKDQAVKIKGQELQNAARQIDIVLQAVSSAKDQASYTRAVQFLQANGIDTANVPPQFDPQAVASFGQMAMTAKQRVDAQLAENNSLIRGDGTVNQPLLNAKQQVAKAGASTVSVNTGQKGLDNEFKLRGEFKSEPIYKAHQEMTSAYNQIRQSLGQASPAGDLAGATKIMKLLDPGSVVRESELGMAMAATGALDRLLNYADVIIKGTKLTPSQRKDFQALADKLYAESVSQYNAKRTEYDKLGSEYGLNAGRAIGPAAEQPKVVDFGSLK